MRIKELRTNHIQEPIGFTLEPITLSWVTESTGKKQSSARVLIASDKEFESILFDSDWGDLNSIAYYPQLETKPRTRYYWQVEVIADNGDCGIESSFFETGKMNEEWLSSWIKAPFRESPLFVKDFIAKKVISAKAYVVGLGIFELYCNGEKVGEEYLAPGHHSYDFWNQTHTYDLTPYLNGSDTCVGLMMGDGWYKGRFGWDGEYYNHYGQELIATIEIHIVMEDGCEEVIATDESWLCYKNPVTRSDIYYGEDYDARLEITDWCLATTNRDEFTHALMVENPPKQRRVDRFSLPIKKFEVFEPKILKTKKNEIVLDFGQNLAGWVEGDVDLPKGGKLQLSYGELLQDDCFYRDNLRTAQAQYTYISNGKAAHFRPHFTYYGFRYVKVEGITDEVMLKTFVSQAIYSDLTVTGHIETSNPMVNQLISNAQWSQKGNFLDVPTDCPQRDERMGWTGDAQVFAGTASFNMATQAFYNKYMEDLMYEQGALNGGVPFVVPLIKTPNPDSVLKKHSSCAWGDVATILPWTLYTFFGDLAMLKRHYESMKAWVDYIKRQDDEDGGNRLWLSGFHFADWLALDNYRNPDSNMGGTDSYYVASAYYAYSTEITAKAAKVLGKQEDTKYYENLRNEIKAAITNEYFTPNGKSAIDTQTAKVLALYMDLVPDSYKDRISQDLIEQLEDNDMKLCTGFVGTPYLCRTLSDHGLNHGAYTLLLNESLPGWLYEVSMGATTIWERWNSLLPDGSISGVGMNSMNHYAYGSILEWMYRNMCGFQPKEEEPGFRKIRIEPLPDQRIEYVNASFDSPIGQYKSSWSFKGDIISYDITIPFGGEAEVIIKGQSPLILGAGNYNFVQKNIDNIK